MKIPEFEVCRSDMGDGGWSLHAPAGDVVPEECVLADGPGRIRNGAWAPVSQLAYRRARVKYRKLYRHYRHYVGTGGSLDD